MLMKFFVLKAYVVPPQLEMKESSIPDLLEDDVLVEVSYSAVNDYDWSLSTGKPFLYRLLFGLFKPKLNPGMGMRGVVKQIGTAILILSSISKHPERALSAFSKIKKNA